MRRWIVPVVAALAALWLLSSYFGQKDGPVATRPPAPGTAQPRPEPTLAPGEVPASGAGPVVSAPSASLYFEPGSANLPADTTGGLEPVIAYLKANPSTLAVVSGFRESTTDMATSEELARNRADAVRNAIAGAGVDEARIELREPALAAGSTAAEDARRVEVTVR